MQTNSSHVRTCTVQTSCWTIGSAFCRLQAPATRTCNWYAAPAPLFFSLHVSYLDPSFRTMYTLLLLTAGTVVSTSGTNKTRLFRARSVCNRFRCRHLLNNKNMSSVITANCECVTHDPRIVYCVSKFGHTNVH